MTTGSEIIANAKAIRSKLMNPENKVKDDGINLRRTRVVQAQGGEVIAKAGQGAAIVKVTEGFVVRREPELLPKPIIVKKRGIILLKIVSRYFGVPEYVILGRDRRPRIAYCRQIYAFLMRHKLKETYPSIGKLLKQDHTTAIHAYQKIIRLMESCDATRDHIDHIIKIFDADLPLYTVSPEYKQTVENVALQQEGVPECGLQDLVGGSVGVVDVAEEDAAKVTDSW